MMMRMMEETFGISNKQVDDEKKRRNKRVVNVNIRGEESK